MLNAADELALDSDADPNETDQALDAANDDAALTDGAEDTSAEADEVVITIGDEPAPQDDDDAARTAPEWVRELRKSSREKDRRIRELEQKVSASVPATPAVVVGVKPRLEDCDYDTEKFEASLEAWHERKQTVDAEAVQRQNAAQAEQRAWDERLEHHGKLKSALKVSDYDDAEATVEGALSVTQRGLIVHGADNSAHLVYALGKNPKTLKELAAIGDPVKFAFAVAKLEAKLKVTPRKAAPVPERQVRGNASTAPDTVLERLRAEADRTGNRTKVAAHMKQVNVKTQAK